MKTLNPSNWLCIVPIEDYVGWALLDLQQETLCASGRITGKGEADPYVKAGLMAEEIRMLFERFQPDVLAIYDILQHDREMPSLLQATTFGAAIAQAGSRCLSVESVTPDLLLGFHQDCCAELDYAESLGILMCLKSSLMQVQEASGQGAR